VTKPHQATYIGSTGWKIRSRLFGLLSAEVTEDAVALRRQLHVLLFDDYGDRRNGPGLSEQLSGVTAPRSYADFQSYQLNNDAGQLESYISDLFLGDAEAARLRDNLGNRRFNEFTYDNQVDNYQQDHYQLHYSYQLSDSWLLNSSLHYTYGRGYFEQYREDDNLSTYNIDPVEIGGETITRSDLIRRRWLDNHFYGTIVSSELKRDDWNLVAGGGYNEYDGDHFGEVIWARFAGDSEHEDRYYDNNGFKTDFNVYGKFNYFFSDALNSYIDLQYRAVTYRFLGLRIDESNDEQTIEELRQRDRINFFNPKFGFVYRFDGNNRAFASLSVGGKEPTRRDYVESTPESRPSPERLYDYELGYEANYDRFRAGVNFYYMHYVDQLILTGAVNDVGAYVRENVPESYRAGVELHGALRLTPALTWEANATFSRNKIPEYTHFLDNFDQGGQDAIVYENSDIAFSPALIGNSILRFHRSDWRAELVSKYVSRQYLDNTQNNSRSIDPYFVNDLRFGYSFSRAPWVGSLDVTLQVNNILDARYVSNGYTFGWIAGESEQHFNYYFPQAGRNMLMKVSVGF
jgi:iron complex outermembrane receptor protein